MADSLFDKAGLSVEKKSLHPAGSKQTEEEE